MERYRSRPKSTFKPLLLIIGGVFLAMFIFFGFKVQQFYNRIYNPSNGVRQPTLPKDKKVFNILMLGYGGGNHEGTYLTDSMMLIHLDLEQNKAVLISIPRDLWVKVPTDSGADFHIKINALYQMGMFPDQFPDVSKKYAGDAVLLKKAVSDITGLTVDNYVAIDFEGFKKAIDIIGGVNIDVAKAFDDYSYPIDGKENDLCGKDEQFKQIEPYLSGKTLTPEEEDAKKKLFEEHPDLNEFYNNITDAPNEAFPCRYEHLSFKAGKQFMNGETALKYVRSRHGLQDGGDFGRASRQQRFVQAVKEKVFTIAFIPKIVPLLDEMKKHITMDITVEQLQKFLSEAPTAGSYKTTNYVLSTDNLLVAGKAADGQYILRSDEGDDQWTSVQQGVRNVILGITPTPTPSPTSAIKPTIKVKASPTP